MKTWAERIAYCMAVGVCAILLGVLIASCGGCAERDVRLSARAREALRLAEQGAACDYTRARTDANCPPWARGAILRHALVFRAMLDSADGKPECEGACIDPAELVRQGWVGKGTKP